MKPSKHTIQFLLPTASPGEIELVYRELMELIDQVQPCEPECSTQRHAYHQGQWDMHQRQEASVNKLFGKEG